MNEAINIENNEIIQKIFDLKSHSFGRFGWVWWFWLFFFENPLNPEKPRQATIIWSAKNDVLNCNEIELGKRNPLKDDGSLQGAVTAWYFDGQKMHENILLNNVEINQTPMNLFTSFPNTSFCFKNGLFEVTLNNAMKFEALLEDGKEFTVPSIKKTKHLGLGYEMIEMKNLKLKAMVDGKVSEGTAMFQKVFLNAPPIPWYWGVFHFENGAFLSYFNPYILVNSVKKNVSFYDGKKLHEFNDVSVKKINGSLPKFYVKAKDNEKTIEFMVETYSKTVWKFRKKKFGLIPLKFDYRQYPAILSSFKFKDLKSSLTFSEKDLGKGIGNAEHSTGILI